MLEAQFKSKVLKSVATIREYEFAREEEAKLVELVLKNANTVLMALDGIGGVDDPEEAEKAYAIVKKIVVAQHDAAADVAMVALIKLISEMHK